jgi:myo-inositol-1(or 4)-monophosphatase
MQRDELEAMLPVVVKAVEGAARQALQTYTQRVALLEKGPGDWSSEADQRIEELLRKELRVIAPSAGFVGEETGARDTKELMWVVDPIDGSANYVRGIPHFATVVSLVAHDSETGTKPILAVTADPCRQETFTTIKGGKTRLNNKPQQVSTCVGLRGLLAAVTPKPGSRFSSLQLQRLPGLIQSFGGFRRSGAMALDLAWLSAGRLDAFIGLNLADWDVLAGALHVEGAGGEVIKQSDPVSNEATWFLAANQPDNLEILQNAQ